MQQTWTAVDDYILRQLVPRDDVLQAVLDANASAGLPAMDVSPSQGKLLQLFAKMVGATKVLELGTLGGYSTIWLARALPAGGTVATIEADAAHAEVARKYFERAGLMDVIDLRVGNALDVLPQLAANCSGPFDLIFIDADKPNNPAYLEWALTLSRLGTIIIGDNVVREGELANPASTDPKVLGVQRFFELIAENPRLSATAIQTVGSKGYDGFALALVTE